MADFMRLKYKNPRMKQSQIADQISLPTGTLQRFKNHINMHSTNRINTNNTIKRTKKVSNGKFDNNSNHESDVKRPQITSKNLNQSQNPIMKLNPLKVKKTERWCKY